MPLTLLCHGTRSGSEIHRSGRNLNPPGAAETVSKLFSLLDMIRVGILC